MQRKIKNLDEFLKEKLKDNLPVNKFSLNESTIKRIKHWVENNDIGIISAFRNQLTDVTENTLIDKEVGDEYSKPENKRRNKELKSVLLDLGYGVTKVYGTYIEGFGSEKQKDEEVDEESFFVVNINEDPDFKDNLFKLSEYYNQDNFLYKEKDSDDAFLVGTNMHNFPGYEEEKYIGQFYEKVTSQFMSRIGSTGFAFAEPKDLEEDDRQTFDKRKKSRKEAFKFFDLKTYENSQTNTKRLIKEYSKPVMFELFRK